MRAYSFDRIGFKAREAWRKHKVSHPSGAAPLGTPPWGVSPRAIAFEFLAREAGGSCHKKKKKSLMKIKAGQRF